MGNRKRRTSDPTKSDSDDEDYGTPSKKKSAVKQPAKKKPKTSGRKKGRARKNSEDENDLEISLEEWSREQSVAESPAEKNPRTGRPSRQSTKNKTYNESGSESVEEEEEEQQQEKGGEHPDSDDLEGSDANVGQGSGKRPARPSLIVKLKLSPEYLRNVKAPSEPTQAQRVGPTRKSSRISEDREQPLMSLTNSGRHATVSRPGSSSAPPKSPTPLGRSRSTRAAKSTLATMAIAEGSQENSSRSRLDVDEHDADLIPDSDEAEEVVEDNPDNVVLKTEGADEDVEMSDVGVQEPGSGDEEGDDDEEGEVVIRSRRANIAHEVAATSRSPSKGKNGSQKRKKDDSSDYEPPPDGTVEDDGEDDNSNSDSQGERSPASKRRRVSDSSNGNLRRSTRNRSRRNSDSENELDPDELAEEARELTNHKRKRSEQVVYERQPKLRDRGPKPDYRILRPELVDQMERPPETNTQPKRRPQPHRTLFSTSGPFRDILSPVSITTVSAGPPDDDSSDDEVLTKRRNTIGAAPITPAHATLLPNATEPLADQPGVPANFGKVKDKKAIGDIDPVGVDQSVNFDSVGGLDNQVNQLKEMVLLPLLYPEVFQQFNLNPPRGVLFHGPPGTGKTLIARALASSVSTKGQKVSFYMRKGADVVSKWVGEAERQLRLLFEEAHKNQPSIIFFDEFDGLAPVRSSKQEQIHASIVTTLLALMDGSDARGQVIVIGATNRPDSIDPAFRRPGRFDREFYFPIPNQAARRSILDIHTKSWEPAMKPEFKDELAKLTQGYTGSDIRALCTEAALTAIQCTFPQIYQSQQKLVIDTSKIKVLAKDFLSALKRIVPSTERSTSSHAAPLDPTVEPLLRDALNNTVEVVRQMMPQKSTMTALEEAQYGERHEEEGFDQGAIQQQIDQMRIFRPRLLIYGSPGMGQNYLPGALLHKFDGYFVQLLDIAVLYEDTSLSPESTVVRIFNEARRHLPSIIYLPDVHVWYQTASPSVLATFLRLIRSIPATDPLMVLGCMELERGVDKPDQEMTADLFGFSQKTHVLLERPGWAQRHEFFSKLISLIEASPTSFPNPDGLKKRELPTLEVAPEPPLPEKPKEVVEAEKRAQMKAQRREDRLILNSFRVRMFGLQQTFKQAFFKKLRKPVIENKLISYLFNEMNPHLLQTDVPSVYRQGQYRPYEMATDRKGVPGIKEVATDKFYYNLDTVTIEERITGGYYSKPRDIIRDITFILADAESFGDVERLIRAREIVSLSIEQVESLIKTEPALVERYEAAYERELAFSEKASNKQQGEQENNHPESIPTLNRPSDSSGATTEDSGSVRPGEPMPSIAAVLHSAPMPGGDVANMSNGEPSTASHDQVTSNGSTDPLQRDYGPTTGMPVTGQQRDTGQNVVEESSAPTTQTPRSQRYPVIQMADNSQLGDYYNSASTTSSDKKTSEQRSSGQMNNSQSTNGAVRGDVPDFSTVHAPGGGSQLPDTQDPSSESRHSSQLSQQMGPPTSHPSTAVNNATSEASRPHLIIDHERLQALHTELVKRSSGCSVQQLEQVNATLMETVWQKRAEWNRQIVMHEVQLTFNATIEDIEHMQTILPNSQDKAEA